VPRRNLIKKNDMSPGIYLKYNDEIKIKSK